MAHCHCDDSLTRKHDGARVNADGARQEDLGRIPTACDWLRSIKPEP